MSSLEQISSLSKEKAKDVFKLLSQILDEQSLVEMDTFVKGSTVLGEAPGEGIVSGFATVDDIQVSVFATNAEVLKGSIGKRNSDKICKSIGNAISNNTPVIGIIDTQGARFDEGIDALEGYGKILKAFSNAYSAVPTIIIVKGSNFGLLSYLAPICDSCIIFEKAVMATTSPLILGSTAGIDSAKIGTSAIHSASTGLATKVVKNEKELKAYLVATINMLCNTVVEATDDANRISVLADSAKIQDKINDIFDTNSFIEIKQMFAPEVIVGYARLNGVAVGVVANNSKINDGRITANAAVKISEFVCSCDSFELPLINLVDCAGSEVNIASENSSLIREIGNLLYTYNQVSVPKLSLILGKAIGLGYTAFASGSIFDYSIACESAVIGVMYSVAGANLIYADDIAKAKDKDKAEKLLAKQFELENTSAITVAQKGYIDNVIEAKFSRQYLIACLQMLLNKR